MSDLLHALQSVVIRRELDLTELDDAYRDPETGEPLALPFRVNWTRGQQRRRWELRAELDSYKKELDQGGLDEARIAELGVLVDQNGDAWAEWWATVLMVEPQETQALQESMPREHWNWITGRIMAEVHAYEVEEAKKVAGVRSLSSRAPGEMPPTDGSAPGSPDS